jgi:GTP cyclohydrolase I
MTNQQLVEAKQLVRRMIELIGDDPSREGLRETPDRVAKSWGELFAGYQDSATAYAKVFHATFDQVVVLKGIDYFSMCEHHILPFFGKCHVAYLPKAKDKEGSLVLGVSKIARLVNVYARRLQIQEQMTEQIADAIVVAVNPDGVAVVVDGTHLCMMSRGVGQQHAIMRTSCMRGTFRRNHASRAEVLHLMGV